MNISKLQQSNYLLFAGLIMLAAGLPVSFFLTSLSQFFIVGSFFLEGSFKAKFKNFIGNKAAVLLTLLWLFHLLGMLWTSDIDEGLKDLRIKLPLLILPIVLAGSGPLNKNQFNIVLGVFIAAVFGGSLVSVAVYNGFIQKELHSIRDIFIFNVSHIRFALFVCLSIFILFKTLIYKYLQKSYVSAAGLLALTIWFLYFLVFIESITGILILIFTVLVNLIWLAWRTKGVAIKGFIILTVLLIPLFIFSEVRSILSEYNVRQDYPADIDAKTESGNPYVTLDDNVLFENGYPIWAYVCEEELRPQWNSISSIKYDSLDEREQPIRFTLIRFLASKGLKKDAEAIKSLSKDEVKSIEKGIANVKYQNLSNTRIRLIQIVWEIDQYKKGLNPSGHSVTQRFEFWKAAIGIIKENPLSGVGTGDMPEAYKEQYNKTDSKLSEKFRLRAHNQYLAFGVGLGIPLLLFFIFLLLYSLLSKENKKDYLFRSFWFIAVLSMLTEDTLETQTGVTFFAFFLCLFLFSKPEKQTA
ncbi:MAG TPA: O-antigen ligase family protein [Bacteroidia bacterium]|nr:O-antigen ligase family protein [Bacteroidia bacterium]